VSERFRKPRRISYGAVVPLPPDEAFAFVCEPRNWPSFFTSMRDSSRDDSWGSVGGRARMTNVVLGRSFTSELQIMVWDPPRELRYVSRQAGAPTLDNRRVFEPVPGGTRLIGTTECTPRPGLQGLLDLALLLVVRRTFAAGMARLPDAARAADTPPGD